jgi:hypothetical protein
MAEIVQMNTEQDAKDAAIKVVESARKQSQERRLEVDKILK